MENFQRDGTAADMTVDGFVLFDGDGERVCVIGWEVGFGGARVFLIY